jgi:hypothetical protein
MSSKDKKHAVGLCVRRTADTCRYIGMHVCAYENGTHRRNHTYINMYTCAYGRVKARMLTHTWGLGATCYTELCVGLERCATRNTGPSSRRRHCGRVGGCSTAEAELCTCVYDVVCVFSVYISTYVLHVRIYQHAHTQNTHTHTRTHAIA